VKGNARGQGKKIEGGRKREEKIICLAILGALRKKYQ